VRAGRGDLFARSHTVAPAEKHNQLLELAAEADSRQVSLHRVSSRQLTTAHAIVFETASDLWPFVAMQCVRYGAGGREVFDFGRAEARLAESLLRGKPVVLQETKLMEFADEAGLGVAGLPSLRSKLPQEELPPETATALSKELASQGSGGIQRCAEMVDTCVAFLLETGGSRLDSSARELPLLEYAQDVLLLGDAQLGARTGCFSGVQLRHIEALRRLLQDCSSREPLSLVSHKYCEPLDMHQTEALRAFASGVQGARLLLLVQAMRDFVISQLKEEHLGQDSQLAMCLGCLEVNGANELRELDWFSEGFPPQLRLREAVACLRMLEAQMK